jgi:hypothetical protein
MLGVLLCILWFKSYSNLVQNVLLFMILLEQDSERLWSAQSDTISKKPFQDLNHLGCTWQHIPVFPIFGGWGRKITSSRLTWLHSETLSFTNKQTKPKMITTRRFEPPSSDYQFSVSFPIVLKLVQSLKDFKEKKMCLKWWKHSRSRERQREWPWI